MKMQIFSGSSFCSQHLAQEICQALNHRLGNATVGRWNNREVRVQYQDNLRGTNVFLVQTFSENVNEQIMELLIMIDAAKRASAAGITVVLPYYPYSKQEKKFRGREPISSKLVAELLATAGATRLLTVDLHEGAIEGFFDIQVDHLNSIPLIIDVLRKCEFDPKTSILVAPDAGAVDYVSTIANIVKGDLAVILKRHPEHDPHEVEGIHIVGEVSGKRAIIIDDMILGGATLVNACGLLKKNGAISVSAWGTHGVLCGNAASKLEEGLGEVWVSDSAICDGENRLFPRNLNIVSIAPLLAEAIEKIHKNKSVSRLLEAPIWEE